MHRVLLVEDQPKLLRSLQRGLREEGFEVLTAETGDAGFELAMPQSVDVIVLDWMLSGRDGRVAGAGPTGSPGFAEMDDVDS